MARGNAVDMPIYAMSAARAPRCCATNIDATMTWRATFITAMNIRC